MTLVQTSRVELCLDFANTLSWRGTIQPSETLHGLDDLLAWCDSVALQDGPTIERLGGWWRGHPRPGAAAFGEAIALRETIYRLLRAAALSGEARSHDLDRLGLALAAAPPRIRLNHRGDGYAWQIRQPAPSVPGLLAPVLWSAGDLLTGPHLQRVRQCANDKCRWLFLDSSKIGNRRWCSMSMCGNRAKAQRHYLRARRN
jgi:predicted RNA-binding Zn ribbon-like protein